MSSISSSIIYIKNTIWKCGRDDSTEPQEFYGKLSIRGNILSFIAGTWHLLFNEIYKRGLKRARGVALPKHATHYGPRSRFPYYNLTTPIDRTLPIYHMRDALNSSVGLNHESIHQYTHKHHVSQPSRYFFSSG